MTPPTNSSGERQFGVVPFDILGSAPKISDSNKTPFRPEAPCERQEPPDLGSLMGPAPLQQRTGGDPTDQPQPIAKAMDTYNQFAEGIKGAARLYEDGRDRQARREQRSTSREYGEFLDDPWPRLQRQIRALGGGG
jgi:hypothetical protein